MVKIYEVGGAVRDQFRGKVAKDRDFVIEGTDFDGMRELILGKGGEIFLETPKYFTIRAKLPDIGAADFALCRADGEYKDGRHPENVQQATILTDLARRDFTMNAIAVNVDTAEVIDPFDGRGDVRRGIIKCVGNPTERFNEDRLRILRALRFRIVLGFFLDDEIIRYLSNEFVDLSGVSAERIREELFKMFNYDTQRSLALLANFPELRQQIFAHNIKLVPTLYV